MIYLDAVSKTYRVKGQQKVVARGISALFPAGQSVALMGRNGAGKSSLLRMMAGSMRPTSGKVIVSGTVSWPVGFAGSFHPDLTGTQNVRFVARLYGVDTDQLVAYVADFSELGQDMFRPFGTYSSGMRSRLAMGTSMGISFDTYLVDEVMSVGDAKFKERSTEIFRHRLENAGAIIVSHSLAQLRQTATMGAVLNQGHLQMYEDLEEAIACHEHLMGVAPSRPRQVSTLKVG